MSISISDSAVLLEQLVIIGALLPALQQHVGSLVAKISILQLSGREYRRVDRKAAKCRRA